MVERRRRHRGKQVSSGETETVTIAVKLTRQDAKSASRAAGMLGITLEQLLSLTAEHVIRTTVLVEPEGSNMSVFQTQIKDEQVAGLIGEGEIISLASRRNTSR